MKPENEHVILDKVREIGLQIAGIIYEDELIESLDMEGKPLIDLPDDSQAVKTTSMLTEKFIK